MIIYNFIDYYFFLVFFLVSYKNKNKIVFYQLINYIYVTDNMLQIIIKTFFFIYSAYYYHVK